MFTSTINLLSLDFFLLSKTISFSETLTWLCLKDSTLIFPLSTPPPHYSKTQIYLFCFILTNLQWLLITYRMGSPNSSVKHKRLFTHFFQITSHYYFLLLLLTHIVESQQTEMHVPHSVLSTCSIQNVFQTWEVTRFLLMNHYSSLFPQLSILYIPQIKTNFSAPLIYFQNICLKKKPYHHNITLHCH
jgi:hypothetical protein